jgi:exonuclease SbcD
LEPLRVLEVVEGNYDDAIQEKISIKNKENYLHFKLKNMSHVTDPMMHLKQIYPNTLALTNMSFDFEHTYLERREAIEQLDDSTIINNFYEDITSTELTTTQKNKITAILNKLSEGGNK